MRPATSPSTRARLEAYPRRVVALGGGTGLPAVLRGLRDLVASGEARALTAVVTMSDDGGSSGRLRRSRGMPPPGDVRNCLVALSAEQDLLAALFQHRYGGEPELGGHTLGNLILAALAEQTGSFLKAVEVSSRVLRTLGTILPVTLEDVTLEATCEDGERLCGESAIGSCEKRVTRLSLLPETARPTPGVVEAIRDADLVVLGPGSFYTSVLSHLVLRGVADALRHTHAVRVLVGNLVTGAWEARGMALADHLHAIREHAGEILDAVLVHTGSIDAATLARYRAEGAEPLTSDEDALDGVRVFRANLLASGPKLRHEPSATVAGLLVAWRDLYASADLREVP